MSSNGLQFGLPLNKPSIQSVLPIVMPSGSVKGFYPITSTTFAGTETEFTLSDGQVPIVSVTLPTKVQDGVGKTGTGYGVSQYMAAQWPANEEGLEPWVGFKELVNTDNTGYYRWWSMPTESIMLHFGRGVLIDSFLVNMNKYPLVPASPEAPVVSNATLRWACSLDVVTFAEECAFFDFAWMPLFDAAFTAYPDGSVIPLSISTVSNPVGGIFKASIVQGFGGQQYLPGGSPFFSTVRILKLQDAAPGTYDFAFSVSATIDGVVLSTPVTLTLTVV